MPLWIGQEVQAVSWEVVALLVYATALPSHMHSSLLIRCAPFGAAARTRAGQGQGDVVLRMPRSNQLQIASREHGR